MAEAEELLDGVAVRLPAAEEIRRRGQRRRARRRAGAATVCAAALLTGAWALLPGGADRSQDRRGTVATAPENPFRKNGVVENLPAREVPLYGTWHWKRTDGRPVASGDRGDILNRAGLAEFCMNTMTGKGPDRAGYTSGYRGARGAVARQCVVDYSAGEDADASADVARDELLAVFTRLETEGLRRVSGALADVPDRSDRVPEDIPEELADQQGTLAWAGKVEGHTLRVFTQRWKSWVSVVGIVDGAS
ncbi:hypothetical protein AB0467_09750 [Streptomyces sp. NPDC052095]|uniref:hypothetical protein n=1 Tax=unclassified Streptomyces TaxID=2593676 RepID=UPI00344FE735